MNIGIICNGKADNWLLNWIRKTEENPDIRFFIYKTSDHDLLPSIVRKSVGRSRCDLPEAAGQRMNLYINCTGKAVFMEEDAVTVHISYIADHYASLFGPLQQSDPITTVALFTTDSSLERFELAEGKFRTVKHSLRKHIRSITAHTAIMLNDYLRIRSNPGRKYMPVQWPAMNMLALRERITDAYFRHMARLLFSYYRWNIGIARLTPQELLHGKKPQVQWMPEEKKRSFNADPFLLSNSGGLNVFFEQLEYKKGKGRLMHATYNNHAFSPYKTLLEKQLHLSYPFTLQNEGNSYILPEDADSNTVTLYEVNSEGEIIESKMLMELDAVDPTIYQWNNRWWLFCTRKADKSADLRLYIYYSESLTGEWKPHPKNPVKCDISNARPAGHLFTVNGKLYRPAQDSSITYGGRILINEVKVLSETSFHEEPVARLEPHHLGTKYNQGLHTISFANGWMAVDAKRKIWKAF